MAVELRHWRAFVAAAESGSFGRAAERISISQPALSQLVQALERHLGAQLFDRTHRRIELTKTGEIVLVEALAIIEQASRAERIGSAAGRQISRSLTAGYVGSAAPHPVFGALMRELAAATPPIILHLDQRPTVEQVRQLGERVLDFAIARSPLPGLDPEIASMVLAREPMMLAIAGSGGARSKTPCRLEDFAAEPFIQYLRQPSGGLRALTTGACQKAGFEPKVSQTVPQIATMLCLVAAGLGVALVPETARRIGVPGIDYRPLCDVVTTDLTLLYRRGDNSPAIRFLLQAARKHFDKDSLSKLGDSNIG